MRWVHSDPVRHQLILTPVQPAQHAALWPWVRDGLQWTCAKTDANWTPEDVRHALVTGNAALWTIGQDEGFAVLQRIHEQGRPVLFVWAIWGPGELEPKREQIWADLEQIAKQMGAATIQARGRKGWERAGFRLKDRIFEREVW